MRLGWIGVGAMGAPMLERLAAVGGHELRAFDVDPTAVERAGRGRVVAAGSAAEAAQDVEVLAVMVATPAQVETVLFGTDGVGDLLPPGAVVLLMATVGPELVEAWGERLAQRGMGLVDAPVSGGTARARTGELLMMVSGQAVHVARVQPVIDALASAHPLVGDRAGEGQKLKLVNQLLCGVHIAAAGEALAFAVSLGLDPRNCWEILRQGAANSFMFDDRGRRMLEESPPVRSAVDIFVKDLGLVNAAASAQGRSLTLAESAGNLFRGAHDAGLGREDDSSLFRYLRDRADAGAGRPEQEES
jgi:3-hydroxyisobutyrate dehydrogenase/putative dehydrogenase